MSKINLLPIILLITHSAYAENNLGLARSEQVSEIEYRAFLLSEPKYFAASQAILKDRPASANANNLRDLYEEAERLYISADLLQSHQAFAAVTEMALQGDWNDSQRAIIFHSFLRAAQTAKESEVRRRFLTNAIRFSNSLKMDENLFPPPLVEEYKAVKLNNFLVPITLPRGPYAYALINGGIIELKKFSLQVPAGEFRLTLISDSLKPVTQVLTASTARIWQPRQEFLVAGTCDTPKFQTEAIHLSGLFDNDCVAAQGSAAIAKTPTLLEQTLQNREPFLRDQATLNTQPFYKKKWFWGIVGVVTAALIIDQNHNEQSAAPQPTTKEGF